MMNKNRPINIIAKPNQQVRETHSKYEIIYGKRNP